MKNKLSILLLMDGIEDGKATIFNIIKNSYFQNIEVILLDNSSEEKEDLELKTILKKYSNIIYIDVKNKEKSESYNIGLKIATGNYISFIEQGVKYEKAAIKLVEKNIKKNNLKLLCLKPYFLQEKIVKVYEPIININTQYINQKFQPVELNLALESYIINKELVKEFDEYILYEDAKIKFILNILMSYKCPVVTLNKAVYYTIPKEDDTSTNLIQYNKAWYDESLLNFIIPFLENTYKENGEVPILLQEAMLYCIFAKYNCNLKDRNKMVLKKDEVIKFFNDTSVALQYIDSEVILEAYKTFLPKLPRWLAYQFFLMKNKDSKVDVKINKNMIYIENENKNILLDEIENEYINVYAIDYKNETIEIDFSISVEDFLNNDSVDVFVTYNDKIIKAEKTNCYPLLKVFGLTISKQIYFHVSIKTEDSEGKIIFYLKYNGKKYILKTKFEKIQSHLNNSRFSYWKINKKYYLNNKREYLSLEKKKILSGPIKEISYFIARIVKTKNISFTLRYFSLRFIYWCVKPFYKNKQIWLTFDKLYKAGDNGEYIYRYIKEKHPEVIIYYVIKKESLDYQRLKKEKNSHILVYATFKHKLFSLLSTAILDTHANVASYCSFDTKKARNYVCDLFNPEIICIQHGLSIQQIAQYQNRLFDNIKLYCCASKYEVKNLLDNPMYDFNKNQIKLTGLARYDGLKNNKQRQILITPTWRRNIVNSNVTHIKKTHNEFFKNSTYYKIYNTLINDEKLIQCAQKNNYKIIYLLHPAISAQKHDFQQNNYVDIIAATDNMNYEKILTESSLMVTDYSGVQFDFAYMRKPIIYYHPEELPPHYEEGGLKYDTMGFGPICKNNSQIVETLCEYMENDCKTKEEYINRANDFFAFDDFNNCERIYNTIEEYMEVRR